MGVDPNEEEDEELLLLELLKRDARSLGPRLAGGWEVIDLNRSSMFV
jgi:hypothetical protein